MGIRLKLRRIELGKKQKDLAEELNISQQYLANLENGKSNNPNRELMIKIAKLLNSTVQELFFDDGE
ncbi:helix-turn-helix transcriptional regulator [Clostridium perfringens]|uniref:helix-turn-helix transcriptional regulator n=1 Tax=Clostridium perfringens TaxID=1502 RepID=UPI000F8DF4C8|nr:helix-turn-helix transcriptional regulator [Clostridium perfringens]EHA1007020.1 helix-turn-helix transcriptional regulator [Clostridium perfringens]EHA1009162.1 helix-turn-helix transcriptional regulator [Clostridium perfringens]EHA1021990.1 helix-turn-helix transcriptional regulator [Clostridium perfringens]EHK2336345.1 helix-turn-helix transcriptional regulator [Clostridium perfringens]EHK2367311.1 helix-turn-helix transcriptional regulator [Clostridium perfringens]